MSYLPERVGKRNGKFLKIIVLEMLSYQLFHLHFSYFGELFGGSVLAEQVFSYPGLGSTLTEAGLKSDTPLLLAIVMIGTLFVFAGNLIADILNSIINPQLRRKV